MAHPHSVVSFPLLPGSPTGQSMRTISFSNLGFPECSNELQLDLNFVQRLSQGSLAVQNEVGRGDPSFLHQGMELDGTGRHQEYVLKSAPDLAMSTCAMDASETPQSHDHWISHADAASADVVADTSVVTGADTLPDVAADEATNEAAVITSFVAVQNETHIKDEVPSLADNQAPPTFSTRKRKNIIRQIPVPLKLIAPVEKKRPSQGTNVNALIMKASIKDLQPKCRPVELTDRKLLLEERKLDLAERRLALEERKMEVTIEIGRGLVTSMERMTTAISALGVFTGPPR